MLSNPSQPLSPSLKEPFNLQPLFHLPRVHSQHTHLGNASGARLCHAAVVAACIAPALRSQLEQHVVRLWCRKAGGRVGGRALAQGGREHSHTLCQVSKHDTTGSCHNTYEAFFSMHLILVGDESVGLE